MTKQEIEQFAELNKLVSDSAESLESRFLKEYSDVDPFPLNEATYFEKVKGSYLVFEFSSYGETFDITFPLSILSEEGLQDYVATKREENNQRKLQKEERALAHQEEVDYNQYLELKKKFEREV